MKWINHQIVTGVAVYAVTDNPLFTVFSMAGALISWREIPVMPLITGNGAAAIVGGLTGRQCI